MAIDPVCKMNVDPTRAAAKAEYQGATFYFCSAACHKAFSAAPEQYVKQVETGAKPPPGAGQRTHS
jgi:YHS domain-containing protein